LEGYSRLIEELKRSEQRASTLSIDQAMVGNSEHRPLCDPAISCWTHCCRRPFLPLTIDIGSSSKCGNMIALDSAYGRRSWLGMSTMSARRMLLRAIGGASRRIEPGEYRVARAMTVNCSAPALPSRPLRLERHLHREAGEAPCPSASAAPNNHVGRVPRNKAIDPAVSAISALTLTLIAIWINPSASDCVSTLP